MRLFIAIDIPADLRVRLAALLDQLRPLAELQWSKAEKLHITTTFIGEWPESRLSELIAVLQKVKSDPIPIAVKGLGWMNPRVLAAGIVAPPALASLAGSIGKALASIGVAIEDREYHPHLTLARRKHRRPAAELDGAVAKLGTFEFGSFPATSFALFLSQGGKYTQLKEFVLVNSSEKLTS
jgi:RNA 2',3'-cyclic 3'-phosphodiesterase